MSGTALLIAIALLLAGFTPTQAQTARDTEPKHAYYLGEIGRAFGLAPLWTADDPPSRHQEIRIWIGFGLFAPQTFTQIESDGNSVRGRKIFWWTAATDSAEEAAADRDSNLISSRELHANLRETAGCGARQRRGDYEMCTAALAPGQTWAGILTTLDSIGVANLPDAASLSPPGSIGLDGWSIVVEVREGPKYRTYSHWSPEETALQPEVRRAAVMANVVARIGYRE